MTPFSAKSSVDINASASKVWDALKDPAKVKQYLFGTNMQADWKVGGKIFYRGEYQGKQYEDKGEVLELVPETKMVLSYWSAFAGLADVPENYQKVSYGLAENNGVTTLTITQENAPSQESADHSAENWKMVMTKLKDIVEA